MTTNTTLPLTLLSEATNGNGATIPNPLWKDPENRTYFTCYCYGTFGNATVKLQISPDDGTNWFDTGITFTAAGARNVEFNAKQLRGVVSAGTGEAITMKLL